MLRAVLAAEDKEGGPQELHFKKPTKKTHKHTNHVFNFVTGTPIFESFCLCSLALKKCMSSCLQYRKKNRLILN